MIGRSCALALPLVAAGLLGLAQLAAADSWTVTQKVSIGNSATLGQNNNQGSTQAVNAIMLGEGGTVVSATQSVEVADGFTLSQGVGDDNRQAGNLVEAGTITAATQSFSAGAVLIERTAVGSNNKQALNMALAVGTGGGIGTVGQTATVASLNFAIAGGNGNRQAGNLVDGASSGSSITQTLTCTGTVTYTDNYSISGTNNLQAGNAVFGGAGTSPIQVFSANSVTLNGAEAPDENNNIKAANYLKIAR